MAAPPRVARLLLTTSLAIGAAACGAGKEATPTPITDAGAPVDPLSWDVTQPGPYTCGHRVLEASYTPPGGLPARTIPVHVWYPSTSTDGDHPHYAGVFTDDHAYDDVPPAPSAFKGDYPVLLHSHGHQGFAGNSARLMCTFASQGWLAVAGEHVGDTLSDAPPKMLLATYIQRPLDDRAALDLVLALPGDDPLAGRADVAHVAMSAHSFGTYDAWVAAGVGFDEAAIRASCTSGDTAACTEAQIGVFTSTDLSEKRAQIIVAMAGIERPFFGPTSSYAPRVPVLMMSGTLNPVHNDQIFAAVTKAADLTWVSVDGGCHQLFGLGNTQLGDPGCAVLQDEAGFALVNPWVLAYARYHVLADRGAEVRGLVEGTTSLSPLVHVQHKGH